MIKLLRHLEKRIDFWFLFIVSFVFFLLRLPSFFEPYWYGDEGIYEVIGFALNKGRGLYTGIWDNKPPFLYLVYAIFNGFQPAVRIFSFFIGLCTIFAFFFLCKKLLSQITKKESALFWVTALFALLFATPLLEGNIANAENFMLLPIFLSALLIFRFLEKNHEKNYSWKMLFLPGILLGIAFLFKVVAVFDFAAFFLFLFIHRYKSLQNFILEIRIFLGFAAGFFLPLFLTIFYFLLRGTLATFIQSAFLSNVGYVGYGNKLFIPQGFLILKLIILGSFVAFIFVKRKKIATSHIFVFLWLAFSVFNALFSQRPYTHYSLTLLGSVCAAIGIVFAEKKIRSLLTISTVGVTLFAVFYFSIVKSLPRSFFGYYANYISFITTRESASDYIGFFDKKSVQDYNLGHFLTTVLNKNDSIFIWGNNGQLYRLTNTLPPGRYIVEYHIVSNKKTLTETDYALQNNAPRYIVIMPKQPPFPFSLAKYKPRFYVEGTTIYEKTL